MGSRHSLYPPPGRSSVFVVVVAAAAAVPAAAAATTLQSRITSVLAAHGFAGTATGLRVFDLSTATSLYDAPHRDTAPAGLQREARHLVDRARQMGRDVPLQDRAAHDRHARQRRRLHRRLYLKGFGDPSLSTVSLSGARPALEDLAARRLRHRAEERRRQEDRRPRRRRRQLLRRRPLRELLEARHERLLRPLSALVPERRHPGQRPPRRATRRATRPPSSPPCCASRASR